MKLVLDTNIFISGLIANNSIPGKIIEAWKNEEIEVVVSEEEIEEIAKVLAYPKIHKLLNWDSLKISNFVSILRFLCVVINIEGIEAIVPDDCGDNHILAALLASKADYLITGDANLLNLKKEYPILTPAEFEKIFFS